MNSDPKPAMHRTDSGRPADTEMPADAMDRAAGPSGEGPSEPAPDGPPPSPPLTRPTGNEPPRTRLRLDPSEEAEIEAMLAELGDQEAVETSSGTKLPPRIDQTGPGGQQRRARVLAVRANDVFVDLGEKSEGVVPADQFPDGPPAVGSDIDVIVERFDTAEGLWVVRRPGAAQQADWSSIAEGMIVEGRVTEANKGGLAVNVSGIRAFMPASQVDLVHVPNLDVFVGQTLRCYVTEVNRAARNVILSRRTLLEAELEEKRKRTWAELEEGQVRTGVVRNVKPFGAFVDIGGVDGLIPIGEMSWARIEDPSEVVRAGQQVQVKVLKVDRESRRLTLGLKQLTQSPWETLEQRHPMGSVVRGKVTKLAEFGAFVEVEPGVEGLVHISELARHHVRQVREVVEVGQEVTVRLLSIDPQARRLALSMKAAEEELEEPAEADAPSEGQPTQPRPKRPQRPLKGGLGDKFLDDKPHRLI